MSYMTKDDWGVFDLEVIRPVNIVLDSDLEQLRRMDDVKRIEVWNQIEHNQNRFEEEFIHRLPKDIMLNSRSKFSFAKLLLAAAAHANGEESPIVERFSKKELSLVEYFEKFTVFDVLSVKEITERMARREDLYDLVTGFYRGQYSDLDRLLDDPEIPKDLKYAFNYRYGRRLTKLKEGVQAYVGQYGPVIVVSQIEQKVWDKIKQSEEERERIADGLRIRIADATSKLGSLAEVDKESESLAHRLRGVERGLLTGGEPGNLVPIEAEKDRLVASYVGFEKEITALIEATDKKQQELAVREVELQKDREGYEQQMQEQKQKLVENELKEVEALKRELALQARSLVEERTSLELKREELNGRLGQITAALQGQPLRVVAKEDAKLCELNFIARFDHKMHEFPIKVFSPIDNRVLTISSWENDSVLRTSDAPASATCPSNESSSYVVSERKHKIFGDRVPKVVIEAVSFNHLDDLTEYGFDGRRANVAEFLGLISRRIKRAELGGYLHILGLASPTGWDERVVGELCSDSFARNYISQHVSVCVIDSITGEVFHNPLDKRIANFIDRFKPEFDEERIQGLTKKAMDEIRLKGFIVPGDFAKDTGEPRAVVLKALYNLERQQKVATRVTKDIGLVFEPKN